MGIEGVGLQLDHGHGNIGAVVRHPLIVGEQIVEHEALTQGAYALLQAVHMVQLQLVAQAVDDLLQRLYPAGGGQIPLHKGVDGEVEDLGDGILHDLQLPAGLLREGHALAVDLLRHLGDVQGVVGDALEVGDGMQVLGYLLTLTGGEFLTGDLHEVGTQPVLIAVHGGLCLRHGPDALVAVLMHQRHGGQQILHGALSHGVSDLTALLDGQRRVLQEALLQTVHLLALPAALGVVRHQHTYQLLQQSDEGHQGHHRGQTEQGVRQSDGHGGHGGIHEVKMHHGIDGIKDAAPDHHAQHVDEQIDEGRALAADVGTKRRQQHRHRSADGNPHDNRKGNFKGDGSGGGQRLQDTHGGGGTLDDAGEHDAHQNSQQGVSEGGHGIDEHLALPQGLHGAAHGGHSVHQHGKAQQNLPHMAGGLLPADHPQQGADGGHQGRQSGGTQQGHPAAAGEVAETQHPAGNAGAQDGAQHDADGLIDLHHAGVDEAHHHHRGGGGGLDHRRDAGPQQDPLDGRAGEVIQHQLQLIACYLLQGIAHDGHTEQEQGHAAQQGNEIRNAQNAFPPSIFDSTGYSIT